MSSDPSVLTADFGLPGLPGRVVAAYGELVRDQIAVLADTFPTPGLVSGIFSARPGGAGPNVAVAVAHAGATARFVGHCGYGPEAQLLLDRLRNIGVQVQGVYRGRYGTCLVVQHPNAEQTFIFDPGDRHMVQPNDVRMEWLEGAGVLHVSSFNIYDATTRPAVGRICSMAANMSIPITIDVSVANGLQSFGVDMYHALLERIRPRIVFCNQAEGDLLDVTRLSAASGRLVVQHRGADSTLVWRGGRVILEVPVPPAMVPFTFLGAGDGFTGGFLASWAQGTSLRAAVVNAHDAARHVITASFTADTGEDVQPDAKAEEDFFSF